MQAAEDARTPEWHEDIQSALAAGSLTYWCTQAALSEQGEASALAALSLLVEQPDYVPPARLDPPRVVGRPRGLTDAQREKMLILHAQGLSQADIGIRVAATQKQVSRLLGGKTSVQARDELVLGLSSLAGHWAGKYLPYSRVLDFDDLAQEGKIGAMQAVSSYDPSKGTPLRVWASYHIRRAISHKLRGFDHHTAARTTVVTADDPSVFDNRISTWGQPGERLLLLDVVPALTQRERVTIVARYYLDWDDAQIAEHIGHSPSTVQGAHQGALRHLRRALGVPEPHRETVPRTSELDNEQVRQMRELRQAGWTYKALGLRFEISQIYAYNICIGRYWPEAGGPLAVRREVKCTDDLVHRVQVLRAEGLSQRAIAQQCGVAQSLVWSILSGKREAGIA